MTETNLDRLKKIVSNEKSGWAEKSKWRAKNDDWLEDSFKVALIVLRSLRNQKVSQKELAERMNVTPQQVNKIVKGKENLSLETLNKLKRALGVDIFKIGPAPTQGDTYVMQVPNGSSHLKLAIKDSKAEESYSENIASNGKSLPVFVKANELVKTENLEVCDLSN